MPDPPSVIAPKPLYALSGVTSRLTHQRFASRGVELRLRSSVAATADARLLVSARDARRLGVKSRVLVRGTFRLHAGATQLATLRPARKLKLKRTTVTATLEVTIGRTKFTKKVVTVPLHGRRRRPVRVRGRLCTARAWRS